MNRRDDHLYSCCLRAFSSPLFCRVLARTWECMYMFYLPGGTDLVHRDVQIFFVHDVNRTSWLYVRTR